MQVRCVLLAGVLAMLAGACSSNDSSTELDLGTVVVTAPPSTVEPPTTTAPEPTTTAPSPATTIPAPPVPTDPPTTPPPTAPAVTPTPSKEDQVRADFESARLARAHCTIDPTTCDYAAIAIPGSPMDVQTREVVAQRSKDNLRSKPGFGDVQVTIESVGYEGESAFLTICAYDTVILFDIADQSNPDDDIVVNDSNDSYRVRWELRPTAGGWLLYEGKSLQHLTGGDLCVG